MLFIDQAQSLVARWEGARSTSEIVAIAAQTTVALTRVDEVPTHVMSALDKILSDEYEGMARSIHDVLRYLRTLAEEDRQLIRRS